METKLITTAIAMTMVSCVFAELVSDESVEQAAASWLSSDRVAQMAMKGLSFDKLEHRGSLRVVHLSPSGYVIMSGSDISDPVISFSRNDFVEPEKGSPFHAMLEHSDSAVLEHEEVGGARTAKWMELIGGRDGSRPKAMRLQTTPAEEPSTVLIEPFMTTHWNQGSPYNDFCPLSDDPQEFAHVPCGCVATAVAQQIAHFKWPWRTGMVYTYDHELDADGVDGVESRYVVRFDGHVPFDWDSLLDVYEWWWEDARGKVPESLRYPMARLIMWVDNIMFMGFGKNGSGAHFGAAWLTTLDWYEKWEWVDLINDYEAGAPKVRANIETGVPVHVGVPGHAVVGHGWASDGEYDYVYLNYGWGGSSDGWYILGGRNADTPIFDACVGFRPKKMVQVEPLPKVSENSFEVKWYFPTFHTNAVKGFSVKAASFGNVVTNVMCDFTTSVGTASDTERTYTTNNIENVINGTDMLYWDPCAEGVYDILGEMVLTCRSVLSYRMSSASIGDGKVEILASFDGGDWQTISVPFVNKSLWSDSFNTYRVFLGENAGKIARFRIKVSRTGGGYWFDRRLLFDDFTCSSVITPKFVSQTEVGVEKRTCMLNGFDSGVMVGVTVKPVFDDGDGIVSECQFTRITGVSHLPLPERYSEYETNDVVYMSTDEDGVWGPRGVAEDETTIRAQHAWSGGFDVALPGKLTEQSTLSFYWYEIGCYAPDTEYDTLTATFVDDDGVETDFWCITNQNQQTERQQAEISLAQFAGKSGGVKIVFGHYGVNYVGDGDIMRFYSPKITHVAIPILPEARWKSKSFATLPLPRIDSVKGHDGMEIDEGLYREMEIGEDTLRVSCSTTVESLHAYPSHLSLMDDNDVSVEKIATGEFLVRMNTSRCTRRSRMILTLVATDANGTPAYRDVSLRFDSSSEVLKNDRMKKIGFLADKKPVAVFQFENNMDNTGAGTLIPSIGGGGISYVKSPLGYAIRHDDIDGPWAGSPLDFPDVWTILTTAKFSGIDNTLLFQIGSSGYEYNGFALCSGGEDVVTLSYWMPHTRHVDLISVNVLGASSKYHTYALRGNGRDIELFVDGVIAGSITLPAIIIEAGFQFFSVIGGSGNTGLVNAYGECIDDWRMYDVALPDTAIVAYANTLLMFDQERAGMEIEDVVVPERWFKKYYPNSTMSKPALSVTAANGRSVWECYVAGLDPTDEGDDLVADITFENGVPKVSIANGEKSNRIYRIYATKSLDGLETPLDVTNVPDLSVEPYGDYRFFRISAELP